MPTSHAINIAALLDALRDWLPDNLDEFAAKIPVDDAERWPDAGGDTRVTELRVRVSYRVLTF
jgi:hypothetical protein